jgi:hypothetical protein
MDINKAASEMGKLGSAAVIKKYGVDHYKRMAAKSPRTKKGVKRAPVSSSVSPS